MATYYIDSAATGLGNGTSWINAWTNPNSATGLTPGDIVYISGGTVSKTYTLAGSFNQWNITNGNSDARITYKIGQDTGHTGIAIFISADTTNELIFSPNYVNISGKLGDGSDGISHFQLNAAGKAGVGINSGGVNGLLLEYLEFGPVKKAMQFNPVTTGLEISHCQMTITGFDADAAIFAGPAITPTAYGQMGSIHHCTLYIPYDTESVGYGADGFQGCGGMDLYNNTVIGIPEAGAVGNHQDGYQVLGGQYVRFYNNLFINVQQYAIYLEPAVSGFSHFRIYNNISVAPIAGGGQAFAIAARKGLGYLMDDVVVVNNLVDRYTDAYTFRDPFAGSGSGTFTNCYFCNNAAIGNTNGNIISSEVTSVSNVSLTTIVAPSYFVSYVAGATDNNYHLVSGATPLIASGTDVSSYIGLLDKDGLPYANPPSVGPYQYFGQIVSFVIKRLGRFLRLHGPSN